MKVLKFGGSSVANPDRINQIIDILRHRIKNNEKLCVVFSAFSGITDLLIEMSHLASEGDENYIQLLEQFKVRHIDAARSLLGNEDYSSVHSDLLKNHETLGELLRGIFLVREASPRTLDYVLSFGERNSNFIIASTLSSKGIQAEYLDARKIIVTNKDFGNAKVNFALTDVTIKKYFNANSNKLQVVTGFIGADKGGLTTTLGRGGSDYTAAIIASALEAQVLEIWTDVDGVLTADPRKVSQAFSLPQLSYNEAMEMSHFGAKVIYPPTIAPALKKNIPIYIKNTFNPEHPGTLIDSRHDEHFKSHIKGISSTRNIRLITIQGSGMIGLPGIAGRIFNCLGNAKVNIILITQASSEHSICLAVSEKEAKIANDVLTEEFQKELEKKDLDPIKLESNLSIIAVVGERMRNVPGVAGKIFNSLGKNGINIVAIAQGSSELNISFIIDQKDEEKALNVIHDSFFLSDYKKIHLFMVGCGLIGGTLLSQMQHQAEQLKNELGLDIVICGIANSRKMVFDERGIPLDSWKAVLDNSMLETDLQQFVSNMKKMNKSNSIFIDNTASLDVAQLYNTILASSISISTPNKIAASSSMTNYKNLKNLARKHNVGFMIETNVGAGLPVMSTIQSMIQSGDTIESIEAVLSGSISFIFNNFIENTSFYDLVKLAKELGFTEPDPRDDLSGQDVKRKATILAREIGIECEMMDIVMHPILPATCLETTDVDGFFEALKKSENYFQNLQNDALKNGKKLRYIAQINKSSISCKITQVGEESPFYNLKGSDNMMIFTTARYKKHPLIIRGPGAGAEVTAAGIFAEIIGHYK